MTEPDREGRKEMEEAVRLRQERRARWLAEGERPIWKNLSMIGGLGWLIVIPTLLGVLLGRWIDDMFETGVTFSGALTFAGACLGLYFAWKRMNQE